MRNLNGKSGILYLFLLLPFFNPGAIITDGISDIQGSDIPGQFDTHNSKSTLSPPSQGLRFTFRWLSIRPRAG